MSNLYQKTILSHPFLTIILLLSIFSFFSFHTQNFKLDASADSLLLEGDKDLEAFREMSSRFKTQDILIITYSVKDSLFTDEVFKHITQLKTELDKMQRIDSVMTLLNIPLLKSADISLADMATNVQNLSKPNIDRKRAKDELMNSPIFKDLIISSDGKTTAILINLANDEKFTQLRQQRDDLSQKFRNKTITPTEQQTLNKLIEEYSIYADKLATLRHQDIENIRHIIQQNPGQAEIHLGGVAMIADDMISYIKSDLIVFGVGVLLFIIATLAIIFRSLQWVILPLMSCFFSAILMIGILGYLDWSVTVISSNVISLMLIITLSMNIHLAVRYRQLCRDFSDLDQQQLVMETVNKMVRPCLYTALTTIIAFMSLVTSGIKPVIDFGWMMTIGLSVTFITSFTLFPAILMLRKKSVVTQTEEKELPLVHVLASITKHHGNKVIATATLLAIITAVGISQLRVENSFIDYFSKDTEIYKGMKIIDNKLGGTTPLDIVINFNPVTPETTPTTAKTTPSPEITNSEQIINDNTDEDMVLDDELGDDELGDDELGDDELGDDILEDDEFAEEELTSSTSKSTDETSYWFTNEKIEKIKVIHDYFDNLPEIGKVLSLASSIRVGEDFNDGKAFDTFELGMLYGLLPQEIKESLIVPYISIEHNQSRISLRVIDSLPDLRRKELLNKINYDLTHKLKLAPNEIVVTGMLVMYNNMLQSLFTSQILTLGFVMLGIALMFLVLFKSFTLSFIGLLPNLLAACIVLGIMGLADIPLDMMTITIAAITIGIAVDNGIHYIYRFREEFAKNNDYLKTLDICHANIGKAVFYTSITIIFGFSILSLSNFIPTILFGLLTALAMFIALLAALTLLPRLILLIKPF